MSVRVSGLICWLAMTALAFAVFFRVTVAWSQWCRDQRSPSWQPERWAFNSLSSRRERIKNFVYPYNFDPTERNYTWWSFGFAVPSLGCAAAAFAVTAMESTRVTFNQLVCTYIAGGFFEVIGILTTVEGLVPHFDGTLGPPKGWPKVRGPVFIIAGIALGFIGNVKSISVP